MQSYRVLPALVATVACATGTAALAAPQACRNDTAQQVPIILSPGDTSSSLQNPCWSPDDSTLVFTRFVAGYNRGTALVTLAPASGGPLTRVVGPTRAQSVNLPGHCWNAASGEIAYTSDPGAHDEVYLAAADGGTAPRQITSRTDAVAFEPSPSPTLADGSRWIVFESHSIADPHGGGELWKVRTNGQDLALLTSGHNDRQPQWSPRGDRIAFQREVANEEFDIWTIDVNGQNEMQVTNAYKNNNTDPSWSPSGNYIVYSSGGRGIAVANLFIVPAIGGPRQQLTKSCGLDGAPGWSHDGTRIAFESAETDPDESGRTTLWTIAAPPGIQ